MLQVIQETKSMDPLQFCYWLQGFAELNNGTPPNDMQWKAIRDHLATVFNKVTPSYPGLGPDWQKEIIKDNNKNPPINYPPVWYGPNTTPLTGPYTVTCSSYNGGKYPNNQPMMIC
jgi:hypothetical protein